MNSKSISNLELAELLRDVAASYDILDEQKYRFQVIAYQRAADSIEKLSTEARTYYENDELKDIAGVGNSISKHITELFKTGKSAHFDEMLSKYPKSVYLLMKVPGIGPKKAYKLSTSFKLGDKTAIKDLLKIAKAGGIEKLEGFGAESQKDIIESINEYIVKPPERILVSDASQVADEVMAWLKKIPEVVDANTLGSLRRRAATVGDIDVSVAAKDSAKVFDQLAKFPRIVRVIERGEHSSSILLPENVQVDVMVQPPESYGSLLQHFTGSKHHNVALREYALKKGMSLSEYGIKDVKTKKIHKFTTEKEFYAHLGLEYVAPELREDTGELQAAEGNTLPELVDIGDIKGDLQMHSDFDIETSHDIGASSMKEMALRAIEMDYDYIAFTEHNPSQKGHSQGDMLELLKRKREAVAKLNFELINVVKGLVKTKKGRVFKVFNSLEVDILPTGGLAVKENGLEALDFALVSIHSSFKQETKVLTKRVIEALSYPNVKIFAHPTARLLNKREGVSLDWETIFDFALKNKKWIEINADPHRLDLPDSLVRDAVKRGVLLTLGTDSHHVDGLSNMKYGVWVARRGWAQKKDIVNTRSLAEFEKILHS